MATLLYDASTKSDDKSGRAQPTDMLYTLSGPTTWSLVEGGTVNATRKTLRMQTMADIESGKKNLRRHRSGLAEGDKGKKQTGKTFLEAKSISARGVDRRGANWRTAASMQ